MQNYYLKCTQSSLFNKWKWNDFLSNFCSTFAFAGSAWNKTKRLKREGEKPKQYYDPISYCCSNGLWLWCRSIMRAVYSRSFCLCHFIFVTWFVHAFAVHKYKHCNYTQQHRHNGTKSGRIFPIEFVNNNKIAISLEPHFHVWFIVLQ